MPQPVICKLTKESHDRIVELEDKTGTPPWTRALIEAEFGKSNSRIYGVRIGGEIIGFTILRLIVDEVHILKFAVDPECQGKGYGRYLLRGSFSELYDQGARRVSLEVRASNKPAVSLYLSEGFYECGIRQEYYTDNKEDALLLNLSLDDFISRLGSEEQL